MIDDPLKLLIMVILGLIVYFVSRFSKAAEYTHEPEPPMKHVDCSDDELAILLDTFAVRDGRYVVPEDYLPLHESIRKFIERFRIVTFDDVTYQFDRDKLGAPYLENQEFLEIGDWGEGSPILVRLKSNDPQVYIMDGEECAPDSPIFFAPSIRSYLATAKKSWDQCDQYMREQEQKKKAKWRWGRRNRRQ